MIHVIGKRHGIRIHNYEASCANATTFKRSILDNGYLDVFPDISHYSIELRTIGKYSCTGTHIQHKNVSQETWMGEQELTYNWEVLAY